jgi:hypothetical protein
VDPKDSEADEVVEETIETLISEEKYKKRMINPHKPSQRRMQEI